MHDLYIFVGHIEDVGNIVYVAAVGVGVAEADRLHIRNLSHNILRGMLIECRN